MDRKYNPGIVSSEQRACKYPGPQQFCAEPDRTRHLGFEPGSNLDHLQAASIAYHIAIGPRAGLAKT